MVRNTGTIYLLTDSGFSAMVSKKAGTSSILQSLWTGPTSIDIPAYMRDAKNGIETYQTGIVHLLSKNVQIFCKDELTFYPGNYSPQ